MFKLNNIVFWDMTPCRLKYRYWLFLRDLHLRLGHLYAIYTVSYHEIATSIPDPCLPHARRITRSPPPYRTPVCHLHDVISRDRHLRPGHLYAFTRCHIPTDWSPCQYSCESLKCCMIFQRLGIIIVQQKTTNARTEGGHSWINPCFLREP
jgi:hypothetical protein